MKNSEAQDAPQPKVSKLGTSARGATADSLKMVTPAEEFILSVLFPGPAYEEIISNVALCLPILRSGWVYPLTIIGNEKAMQPSIGPVWLSIV